MKVTLLDHMGSDLTVVNAARVSFDKRSEWAHVPKDPSIYGDNGHWGVLGEKDAKLISYLAKHNHWTPFAHCFAQLRVKVPIFVARQLAKHQVGLVCNEQSRRYIDDEPEFWFPETWRVRPEGSMKQGSGGEHPASGIWGAAAVMNVASSLQLYSSMIADGVAPEQARIVLPLNTHTEWYWSGSLAAWARVCKLRLDPHAQIETHMIAELIYPEMQELFPVSWAALMEEHSPQLCTEQTPA